MSPDERPAVWVGHVALRVPEVAPTVEFMVKLGMRHLEADENVGILELRAGTHLIVLRSEDPAPEGAKAPFDLMVDDIGASRARYAALGLRPSEIRKDRHHSSFTVVEPGGHEITVNSSHASGMPV